VRHWESRGNAGLRTQGWPKGSQGYPTLWVHPHLRRMACSQKGRGTPGGAVLLVNRTGLDVVAASTLEGLAPKGLPQGIPKGHPAPCSAR